MPPMAGQKTTAEVSTEVAQEFYGLDAPNASSRPPMSVFRRFGQQAYLEVCASLGWDWVFRIASFNTSIGQTGSYAVDENAREVLWMTIPELQYKLVELPHRDWILRYPGGYSNVAAGQPAFYVKAPMEPSVNNGLRFYLGPGAADKVYTVRYGYLGNPGVLAYSSSEYTIIPAQWQDLWRLKWLMKLYRFAGPGAAEKHEMARQEYERIYRDAWLDNQSSEDVVDRWRDLWIENRLAGSLDSNRVLFFGGLD